MLVEPAVAAVATDDLGLVGFDLDRNQALPGTGRARVSNVDPVVGMETGVRVGHQAIAARALASPGRCDVENALAASLDAGAVDRMDPEVGGQDAPDRAEHPALQLTVVGRVEEDDRIRRATVVGGLRLARNPAQRVNDHPRLLGSGGAGGLNPLFRTVPVLSPELDQVLAVRDRPDANSVNNHVVKVHRLAT